MPWPLVLVPTVSGAVIVGVRVRRRGLLIAVAGVALVATLGLAVWAATGRPSADYTWGAGLVLHLAVDRVAAVVAILVPAIAVPVTSFAVAHEPGEGLSRLVGLLVAFVGAMELLVVAADFLSLLAGWGLVTGASWALIAHEWRDRTKPAAAAHAFNATRFGELGLFVTAGMVFASTGSLRYEALGRVHGAVFDAAVVGVVLAAVSKSAQLPFSPWLFSAMAGPSPVSALLHSATMVAAGAFILVRLHPLLDRAGWFAPVMIGVGVSTALAGGVVAAVQGHAKKLLAASTSAHYGLMLVAIGAGFPAAALAHLVTHAAFKSLLFLTAGIAIAVAGTEQLQRMRLGRRLPTVAVLSAIGALALAGVPPLGGAWTKEHVVSAGGHWAAWLAVVMIVAGALSAFYATRFQLLAYGAPRASEERARGRAPSRVEIGAIAALAAATLGLGLLWVPGAQRLVEDMTGLRFAAGESWELAASLATIAVAIYTAFMLEHRHATVTQRSTVTAGVGEWFALGALTRVAIVDPIPYLARTGAVFDDRVIDAGIRGVTRASVFVSSRVAHADDRVVDAGIRGVAALSRAASAVSSRFVEDGFDGIVTGLARLFGVAGRDTRRLQTGRTHQYYVLVGVGLVALVIVAALWR